MTLPKQNWAIHTMHGIHQLSMRKQNPTTAAVNFLPKQLATPVHAAPLYNILQAL